MTTVVLLLSRLGEKEAIELLLLKSSLALQGRPPRADGAVMDGMVRIVLHYPVFRVYKDLTGDLLVML